MMSILGKIHEILLYGVISAIICMVKGAISPAELFYSGLEPTGFIRIFYSYMFWSVILFLPISFIGALATKYLDYGRGLTFKSYKIVIIMFAHVGEDLLGLVLTPFWFLIDLISKKLNDAWKLFDYATYAIEIVFIVIGMLLCFT